MSVRQNRQVRLKSRPAGIPQAENFEIAAAPLPEPKAGEFVVRNRYLSVDPAMRGWVSAVANYAKPVGLGEVMRARAVGEIVASRHPEYRVGEVVVGWLGWQDYALSDGSGIIRRKVHETDLPLSAALGVLGMNGVTAYFGLLEVGQPQAGRDGRGVDRGGLGRLGGGADRQAPRLPRRRHRRRRRRRPGCAARSSAMTRPSTTRRRPISTRRWRRPAPPASTSISTTPRGRSAMQCCAGSTSAPASSSAARPRCRAGIPAAAGPRVERHLLVKSARMEGFLVFDYEDRSEEAVAQLAQWVRDGRLRYREDMLDGLEAAPDAIAGLYRGDNLGKRLIRLG